MNADPSARPAGGEPAPGAAAPVYCLNPRSLGAQLDADHEGAMAGRHLILDEFSQKEIETRAARATLAGYFEAAPFGLLVRYLANGLIVWYCWREQQDATLLWWLPVYLLFPSVRAYFVWRFKAASRAGSVDPQRWHKAVLYPTLPISLAYSASFWFLIRDGFDMANGIVTLYFLLLISATTHQMIGHRSAMIAFAGIGGAGLALRLACLDGSEYGFFAIAIVLFTFVQLIIGLRADSRQREAVKGAIENEMLASRLSEQVKIASQATEEAVRASKEKSRFLAAATHDLRQPLHALALSATSLSLRLKDGMLHDEVSRVMQSLDALEQSLNGMLDLSKLEAGSHVVHAEIFPLAEIFQNLYRTFKGRAEARGLNFRMRSTDLMVYGDRQLLTRLLANLVDNAIKYTPSGSVHIAAKPVRPDNGLLQISVRDSGIGIPQEYLAQIFDEFFQVNNPGRQRSQGMGLGLSIVRRLADLMNVTLRVSSQPGCGSRFDVLCRTVTASEMAAVAAQSPDMDFLIEPSVELVRGRRILLVDNEVDILRAARDVLESAGASVELATSADEARAKMAERGPFDVAMLDYRLGGEERGTELSLTLQALQPENLRIMLITGDTSSEEIRKLQGAGVQVLFKPLGGERLLLAIAEVLLRDQA
jgi:signal transduction histidine kinase